jgi:catechol-2,3-dioxygenase
MLTISGLEVNYVATLQDSTLTRIGQIAITAHDVDRATAFYRDVMGRQPVLLLYRYQTAIQSP